jgi:hypothetical protein
MALNFHVVFLKHQSLNHLDMWINLGAFIYFFYQTLFFSQSGQELQVNGESASQSSEW